MWGLLLRCAVGGVLLFHVVHLTLPGPRPATRVALVAFTLSLIAYLLCQRAELLFASPRPVALVTLALCVCSQLGMHGPKQGHVLIQSLPGG